MKMKIFVPRDATAVAVGADEVIAAFEQIAEKRRLAAPVMLQSSEIDLRAFRDGTDGRSFVAVFTEDLFGGVEELRHGFLRQPGGAHSCLDRHAMNFR